MSSITQQGFRQTYAFIGEVVGIQLIADESNNVRIHVFHPSTEGKINLWFDEEKIFVNCHDIGQKTLKMSTLTAQQKDDLLKSLGSRHINIINFGEIHITDQES